VFSSTLTGIVHLRGPDLVFLFNLGDVCFFSDFHMPSAELAASLDRGVDPLSIGASGHRMFFRPSVPFF